MNSAVRLYRIRSVLVGVPALLAAASCVPQPVPTGRLVHQLPASADQLLRRLALTVPTDLPATSLPLRAAQAIGGTLAGVVAQPFLSTTQSPDDAGRAVDCLTAAVYYEARSQTIDGQRAVAQVVLNRVRDRAFPNSVCGVVYQGSARRTGCQFSFTCDGSMNARREEGAWETARAVATAALAGSVYAPIGSATYYHADSILPWWASSLARVGAVGSHIFYRWRGAMERTLAYSQAYSGVEPGAPVPALAAAAAVTGVTVHRGEETGSGVTIHRGLAPATAPAARSPVGWGIRVHYGTGGATDAPAAVGAIVSDEI